MKLFPGLIGKLTSPEQQRADVDDEIYSNSLRHDPNCHTFQDYSEGCFWIFFPKMRRSVEEMEITVFVKATVLFLSLIMVIGMH